MTRVRLGILVLAAFGAGVAAATWLPVTHAQGALTELKRVDLGSWCEGKEAVIQSNRLRPSTSRSTFIQRIRSRG
jgi:hypothetical protein